MKKTTGLLRRMKGAMLKYVHGMITCREFEQFVLSYLEGDLPTRQAKRFKWHLRICRECREYLAAYQRSMEIGKAVLGAPGDSVPDEVPEDLVKAVLDARRA